MSIDFSPFFAEYEKILNEVSKLFENIQANYSQEVRCSIGCCDCCYALFDLSLVEAMYINSKFKENIEGKQKDIILERADQADRQIHKIKHRVFKKRQQGVETNQILEDVARQKIRCPLLEDDKTCALYAYRPVTCRAYGLPLSIGGEVHSCAYSAFEPGGKYPTIYMDKLQDRMLQISQRMVQSIPTKYDKLAEVLVPLSMALLTDYNHEYLGIPPQSAPSAEEGKEEEKNANAGVQEWVIGGGRGEGNG